MDRLNMQRLRAIYNAIMPVLAALFGFWLVWALVTDPRQPPSWQGFWDGLTRALDEQVKAWHLLVFGFVIVGVIRHAAERITAALAKRGHELDEASAALVPPDAIGRMLSLKEAGEIIRRIERGIPKRPAAASVKRRGSVRTRARR